MVKNTKGGGKAKKQARKNVAPQNEASIKARYSEHPDEVYACCSKLLGNGTCAVMCIDGTERLCIIRNKFRGRGKRGNVLTPGTWCMVGRRDFEKPREGKLEKTDLLEVYGDVEKKKLIQKEIGLKDKWKLFNNLGGGIADMKNEIDEEVMFQRNTDFPDIQESESEEEESDTDETQAATEPENKKYSYKPPDLGDEIDIDDI